MIAYSLLSIFLPAVLLIFIVVSVVKYKDKGGEAVIRHLYTYLVLFATLMMVIGGGISIFMAAADLISPPSYYQSYDDYKMMKESGKIPNENGEKLTEKELRANYEQAVEDQKNQTRGQAKNQIIKSLGFIIIPLPIFLYFNSLRKKQNDI
ncbi:MULTISPECIES: hypothetical protein [Neobacillus]|uniref:DUF4199 domain-containing protein n=1 Tax=Neobacillus rhizophilus TaxID=2833579 RepID=A0A942U692_9BACI|nr:MULTISPECIES: hypothetical protein [Neobacillus]MBS4211749.1 hypothetical protein [Neobacillus rhizophilus]MBU8919499.1 hypothetical protein [Bacillus sp. FJAT-29953]